MTPREERKARAAIRRLTTDELIELVLFKAPDLWPLAMEEWERREPRPLPSRPRNGDAN